MFCLRRIAIRTLSLPSTPIASRSRSITTFTSSFSRPQVHRPVVSSLQKRFASEEVTQAQRDDAEPRISSDAEDHSAVTSAINSASETVSQKVSDAAESLTASAGAMRESLGGATASAASGLGFDSNEKDIVQSKTVYVGNLFFDVEPEDLKREFEKAGSVEGTKIIKDHRGLSKGFGYVDFETVEGAGKAIEMFNMQNFEGRRLSVQYTTSRGPIATGGHRPTSIRNPPSKTLFIGNMAFDMSDRDLNNLFSKIKNVIDVRVAIDRRTGQPRGFAHADFVDVESAVKAMEVLQDKEVCGRTLRIDYSASNPSPVPRDFKMTNRGQE